VRTLRRAEGGAVIRVASSSCASIPAT